MTASRPSPEEFARDLLADWVDHAETTNWPAAIDDASPDRPGRRRSSPSAFPHPGTAFLLHELVSRLETAAARLIQQSGGQWIDPLSDDPHRRVVTDPRRIELVAEAVESGLPQTGHGRLAVPVVRDTSASHAGRAPAIPPPVLLVDGSGSKLSFVVQAARVLALVWELESRLAEDAGRIRRQHFLLDAAVRWSGIEDTDELLSEIAAAATETLGAERASIFLWDRRRGKLIGRPALGVEGGQLEVADDAGVVGAVLRDRAPRRWVSGEDPELEVNRSVDRKLRFLTRSLAAVPMIAPSGELLGVFEVVNKQVADEAVAGFSLADLDTLTELSRHAAAAIRGVQTRQRLTQTRDRLIEDVAANFPLIGDSPAIRVLRDSIARVAPTDLAVLLLGENGTGKEVLARGIHFQSSRRGEPFVAVNCAALVETLLESELFGHQRGAFTDAHQDRIGKFEAAHGGTLFLDEIGDLSAGGQAKLLRVLEEKVIVRVGGSIPIPVDVRIIAATNQALAEAVAQKRFREDFFFRLNVVTFQIPPLRARGEDILLLANHFLTQFARQSGRGTLALSSEAEQVLLTHPWRGNVRELRNVMERASYLARTELLMPGDLGLSNDLALPPRANESGEPHGLAPSSPTGIADPEHDLPGQSLADATREFQIRLIRSTIRRQSGNLSASAQSLGLHRANLYRKLRQLGIPDG